jgi:hypothetical protein
MIEDIRELRRSIGGLHKKLDALAARSIAEQTLCSVCRPDVDRHERILIGVNGDGGGLVDRIGRLERIGKWVWSSVCALATAIVTLVAAWLSSRGKV